jgi:hypothetical protein
MLLLGSGFSLTEVRVHQFDDASRQEEEVLWNLDRCEKRSAPSQIFTRREDITRELTTSQANNQPH